MPVCALLPCSQSRGGVGTKHQWSWAFLLSKWCLAGSPLLACSSFLCFEALPLVQTPMTLKQHKTLRWYCKVVHNPFDPHQNKCGCRVKRNCAMCMAVFLFGCKSLFLGFYGMWHWWISFFFFLKPRSLSTTEFYAWACMKGHLSIIDFVLMLWSGRSTIFRQSILNLKSYFSTG